MDEPRRNPRVEQAERAEEANAESRSREVERAHEAEAERLRDAQWRRPPDPTPERAAGTPDPGGHDLLFTPAQLNELHERWTQAQTQFVDEPRRAVEEADHLVAETVKHLAESFAAERSGLEGQWARGDQVSTEDLRQILRRYRSFFDRLLSV